MFKMKVSREAARNVLGATGILIVASLLVGACSSEGGGEGSEIVSNKAEESSVEEGVSGFYAIEGVREYRECRGSEKEVLNETLEPETWKIEQSGSALVVTGVRDVELKDYPRAVVKENTGLRGILDPGGAFTLGSKWAGDTVDDGGRKSGEVISEVAVTGVFTGGRWDGRMTFHQVVRVNDPQLPPLIDCKAESRLQATRRVESP